MITDEIMDALDILINICNSEDQKKGMETVRKMLADFDNDEWMCMESPAQRYEWVAQYLFSQ